MSRCKIGDGVIGNARIGDDDVRRVGQHPTHASSEHWMTRVVTAGIDFLADVARLCRASSLSAGKDYCGSVYGPNGLMMWWGRCAWCWRRKGCKTRK